MGHKQEPAAPVIFKGTCELQTVSGHLSPCPCICKQAVIADKQCCWPHQDQMMHERGCPRAGLGITLGVQETRDAGDACASVMKTGVAVSAVSVRSASSRCLSLTCTMASLLSSAVGDVVISSASGAKLLWAVEEQLIRLEQLTALGQL